jgi:hypothetical protein
MKTKNTQSVENQQVNLVKVNIIAELNVFNFKQVHLVFMHLSTTRPKQFEDNFGNLWNPEELSNFNHVNF